MAKPRIQQCVKEYMSKCFFCEETDYALLDTHRILPGGVYQRHNILAVCSNCHRRIHDGQIIIDRKYPSTAAVMYVHFWRDGVEYWEPEKPESI